MLLPMVITKREESMRNFHEYLHEPSLAVKYECIAGKYVDTYKCRLD